MDDQLTWQVGIQFSGYWSLPICPCCIPGSLSRSHGCLFAAFIVDTVAGFLVSDVLLNMVMLFGFMVSCVFYVLLVLYSLATVAGGHFVGRLRRLLANLTCEQWGRPLYTSEQGA